MSTTMRPPTAVYSDSNSDRKSIRLPGHCERCARLGDVRAHPNLGCGDVCCYSYRDDNDLPAHSDAPAAPAGADFHGVPVADRTSEV